MTNTSKNNPLLDKSPYKYEAIPFDLIKKEHFMPAVESSILTAKAAIEKIKSLTSSPTFENTILALESAPHQINMISGVFFNLLGAESDDDLQAMAKNISPLLSDFSSDLSLDPKLFEKIKAVYDRREELGLSGEELMITEKTYKDFARNGALLDETKKQRMREIDQELAQLGLEYSDRILRSTNEFELLITDKAELSGLPDSALESFEQAAKNAGKTGWLLNLQAPTYSPVLTYADNRVLREKMWRAFNSRASFGENENKTLCLKIVRLKDERARILGFGDFAAFTLEERMAETSSQVMSFLDRLVEKSTPAAKRDVQTVKDFQKTLPGEKYELMPWDYGYLSEKLKKAKYDFDEEELRPYFKLENVIAGAFEHARMLYGLIFKPLTDIPVYHPDVKTYEVVNEKTGELVGLFYADFFPRKGKRSGAWMTGYKDQGLVNGQIQRPHISIVCNFIQPTETKPSLLNMMEVRTLFHEFGHSLHGLLSNCKYTSLSGTNVFWDFVELPSQIMENWVLEKEALDLFATHYQTGEPIPIELTEKIKSTAQFQAGYASLRQLQLGLLDMAWHSTPVDEIKDVDSFEKKILGHMQLLPTVEGTVRSTNFGHIFAGGYAAGYYSYKWAEVLDADAFELFKERGLFNQEVAESFKTHILSRGGSEHPMILYKKFRGREPDPDALLRRDGLI
jgi:peptidyl-dipeptidase Dcp